MTEKHFFIRPAENTKEDILLLTQYMKDLAAFDGHTAHIEPEKLRDQLFYEGTNVKTFLAIRKNEPIGFLLCYESFSVYSGERGLYVPGAYIIPQFRHKGYGVRLFQQMASYALENGVGFMNWLVEDNNENANKIYRKMGGEISEGWSYVRIPKTAIEKAATKLKKHKAP